MNTFTLFSCNCDNASIKEFFNQFLFGFETLVLYFSHINEGMDPLRLLPPKQRTAMEKTVDEINWLLEDEISSALRVNFPITENNLDRVAEHVVISKNRGYENCIHEKRYFMFVNGIEKASVLCLPLFICELESATLDRYRLRRVGKYYCMVINPNLDEESDAESIPFEDIKDQAKVTRKNHGHRRSQSDFTNRISQSINYGKISPVVSKSSSLPDLYSNDIDNEDGDAASDGAGSAWWGNGNISCNVSLVSSSSKENSTPSFDPSVEREHFQRSYSYSENQHEKLHVLRRRFSCSDLQYTTGSSSLMKLHSFRLKFTLKGLTSNLRFQDDSKKIVIIKKRMESHAIIVNS